MNSILKAPSQAARRWPWTTGFIICTLFAGMSLGGGLYMINTNPSGIWWGIGFGACALTTFRIIKQRSMLSERSASRLWIWSWIGGLVLGGLIFLANTQ